MSKTTIEKAKRIVFFVLNLVLSIITMSLIFTLTGHAANEDVNKTSFFLGAVIISVLAYQAFLFIKYPNVKDRTRLIIISIIYIVSVIFAFLAKNNYKFFFLSAFTVIFAVGTSQILRVFIHNIEKTKTEIFTNVIAGLTLYGLAISMLVNIEEKEALNITIVPGLLLLLISMKNIIMPSLKLTKVKIFADILVKTHTIDVIICLLAMIITFSFLFPMFEGENISNYWDAMWYCFAVITTIGFGDFAATNLVGRVLTVVLGIYGIVVVAILTSVIVSYYGTISKKEAKDDKYIE